MTRLAFQLLQTDRAPGPDTRVIPHLEVDPAVFNWVNPNDAGNPNIVSDPDPNASFLAVKPPPGQARYLAYVFESIAHYTDGLEDKELSLSTMARPDPSRGPVAYYLNGSIVYVRDVASGLPPRLVGDAAVLAGN